METKALKQFDEVEQILEINRAAKLATLEREYIDRTAAIEKDHKLSVKTLEKARNIVQTAFAMIRVFSGKPYRKLGTPVAMVGGGVVNSSPEVIIPRKKRTSTTNN